MKALFKHLRKRCCSHRAMTARRPIGRTGEKASVVAQSLMKEDDDDDDDHDVGSNITDCAGSSWQMGLTSSSATFGSSSKAGFASSSSSSDELGRTGHLCEPGEIDHPIRCPHPEPGIIQDGWALKERQPSVKRRGQLPFLSRSEVERRCWSCRSAPSDYRTHADLCASKRF